MNFFDDDGLRSACNNNDIRTQNLMLNPNMYRKSYIVVLGLVVWNIRKFRTFESTNPNTTMYDFLYIFGISIKF